MSNSIFAMYEIDAPVSQYELLKKIPRNMLRFERNKDTKHFEKLLRLTESNKKRYPSKS